MNKPFLICAIALLFSAGCSDSPVEPHAPVSGIWQSRIQNFGDSLDVALSFSFDETDAGTEGGIRLVVFGNSRNPNALRGRVKAGHTLQNFHDDGQRLAVEGTAVLGSGFGIIEFSGELSRDSVFSFRYRTKAGSGSAVAQFVGPYVKAVTSTLGPHSPSLQGRSFSMTLDSLAGNYPLLNSTLMGTMVFQPLFVTDAGPDGLGGIALNGILTANTNGLVQGFFTDSPIAQQFQNGCDVWPGGSMVCNLGDPVGPDWVTITSPAWNSRQASAGTISWNACGWGCASAYAAITIGPRQ